MVPVLLPKSFHDMVSTLYEMRNVYIKFPMTFAKTAAWIETFAPLSELPNVAGANSNF